MRTIVLIDDDEIMHAMVQKIVNGDYKLSSFYTLQEAEARLSSSETPVLIIIDRMLPDGDGLSLCTKIKSDARLAGVPIIFLSSMKSESDKVSGLYAGADDYVAKPFSLLELKARIHARLRNGGSKISLGNLIIDLASHKAMIKAGTAVSELDLTRKEFKLLTTFVRAPNRVFSREQILSKVWGQQNNVSDRVVDTSLSHLRRKIVGSGLSIEALRGEGYRLILNASDSQTGHAA